MQSQASQGASVVNQPTQDQLTVVRQSNRAQCFTEPAIKLDLMLIPGGTFIMGSPEDELGRWDDEGPPT
jgi:formylglycine-generating enzyme required for sulfatase activity